MALYNIQYTTLTANGAGTHSTSHDAGSSPTWMVIGISGGTAAYSAPSALTYGGVSLNGPYNTVRYGWVGGYGDTQTMMFYRIGGVPSGSNTLSVTWGATAPAVGRVHIWTGRSKGNVSFVDNAQDSGLNTSSRSVALDGTSRSGNGFCAFGSSSGMSGGPFGTGAVYALGAFTVDGNSYGAFGHETVAVTGTREVGLGTGMVTAGNMSALLLEDSKDGAVAEPPSSGSGYRSIVLGKGPQSYWRLHQDSGNYIDIVSALDGTHNGTITREVTGNFTWESSLQKNLGIGLGTAAGYVSVGDFHDYAAAASYSVMAWVAPYADQGTGDHYLVSKLDGTLYGWAIGVNGSDDNPANALFARRASASGTDRLEGGIVSPYSNKWYCVLMTFDEDTSTHRLYFDGTMVAASISTILDLPDHADALLIGSDSGASNFDGAVDEVAIWDRALTEREAWELWYLGSSQQRAKEKESFRDLSLTHFPAFYHRLGEPYAATGAEVGNLIAERNTDNGVPWDMNVNDWESFGYSYAPTPRSLNLVPNGTFSSSLNGWTRSDVDSASWQSDGAGGGYLEIVGDGTGTEDVDNDYRVLSGIHVAYEVSVNLYSTVTSHAVFELVRYDETGAEVDAVAIAGPTVPSSWETATVVVYQNRLQTGSIGFRCSVPSASTATSRFADIVVVPARGLFERGVTGPTLDRYNAGARLEYGPLPGGTWSSPSHTPEIFADLGPYHDLDGFLFDKWPFSVSLWFKVNALNPTGGGTITTLWSSDADEGGD